jgi:RNA polymerase sigma-70 factor, ECF subfamily
MRVLQTLALPLGYRAAEEENTTDVTNRPHAGYREQMSAPQHSDEVLMARATDGDRDAFAMLFFRHDTRLRAFLTRFMGNASLAEDATQEAFADAWRYRARFDPARRPFRVWLFALGANAARSELKRRAHQTGSLNELAEPSGDDATSVVLLRSLVRDALAGLPEQQRLVLVLTVYEGYSYREAAQILGGTEIAARVLCHRARQVLKKRLAPLLESEESYA